MCKRPICFYRQGAASVVMSTSLVECLLCHLTVLTQGSWSTLIDTLQTDKSMRFFLPWLFPRPRLKFENELADGF
jgi:hypothetical protein